MPLSKYEKQLLVVIAEAAIEDRLIKSAKRLGAHGYTVSEVRGAGSTGIREGAWEADRTVRIEIISDGAVADAIAEHLLETYAPHYSIALYFATVAVLRPGKY